ncbi:MAG: hypothetical protein PVF68_07590 [Acidobacteriota bacterium]
MQPVADRSQTLRTLLVLLALGLMVQPAGAAIQLVHMNNGRVLKAEQVDRDGDWIMAKLDGGNTIGFPSSEVEFVEEDPLGREDIGGVANVVTSGREVLRRGAFRGNQARQNYQSQRQNPLAGRQVGQNPNAQLPQGAVTGGEEEDRTPVPGSAVEEQQQPNNPLNLGVPRNTNNRATRFNRLGNSGLRSRPDNN